jgi:nucleoside-diphosphate-sugar epimerase
MTIENMNTKSMISLYGASGFIGSNFKKIYGDYIEIQRDERNPKTNKILYFISTVDNYNIHDNITLDVDTNLKILCEVLDYCRSEDIVFNFISSWFVYGKTPYLPATEDSICNPTGFYSITKKCAEDLLISFCNTYGVKYRIMRLCNVLGAGDQKASKKKNAITWMIDELKLDHDIYLYDQGSNCRDVMHVQDVCSAIKLICDNGEYNQIYNIGSGKPTTIGEIITLAKHYLKSKSKINYIDPPKFHNNVQTKNFWMNTKKLKSLGFEQKLSLEFIIKDLCL